MRTKNADCTETMQGMADPDHTHTCTGDHQDGDHFCPSCRRWWWQAPRTEEKKKESA